MQTPIISILMFVAASVFAALGQFLYKGGADAANGGVLSYVTNPRILAGVGCYTAVMVLFVAAFKRGGSLSVLYPVYASTFIFAALISYFAFDTAIKPVNVLGMMMLVEDEGLLRPFPHTKVPRYYQGTYHEHDSAQEHKSAAFQSGAINHFQDHALSYCP